MAKRKNAYYAIEEDSREQWLDSINNVRDDTEALFITDWVCSSIRQKIFGIGINISNARIEKFTTELEPYLYVWSTDPLHIMQLLQHLRYVDVQRSVANIPGTPSFNNNNVSLLDGMLNNFRNGQVWQMYKVPTVSFSAARQLHALISNSAPMSYYLGVTGTWSLEVYMLLMFYERMPETNIHLYGIMVNKNLEINQQVSSPGFDVMVFDLECVSHERERLPFGDMKSDIIFSFSLIRYMPSSNMKRLDTVFNLPWDNTEWLQKAKDSMSTSTNAKYGLERHVHVYRSEEALLQCLFSWLSPSNKNAFIFLAYNSKTFDVPFLLKRAAYLNLPEVNNFFYKSGIIVYGANMIHIDMYQLISKYYMNELKSFSLNNVARELLHDMQKVAFNARDLRFIYRQMMIDGYGSGVYLPNQEVDFNTLLQYNEMDCLVVFSLWRELQYEEFLHYVVRHHFLPLIRVAQTGMSEYLNSNMIYEGLKRNFLCAPHHSITFGFNDDFLVKLNINKLAAANYSENGGFSGGFNYCNCQGFYHRAYGMDAQGYYPNLISGMNLSHESTLIFTVGALHKIHRMASTAAQELIECLHIYLFTSHKSIFSKEGIDDEQLLDNMASKFYIYGYHDNCTLVSFHELYNYDSDQRILVINMREPALLATFMNRKTDVRNEAKRVKGLLEAHLKIILVGLRAMSETDTIRGTVDFSQMAIERKRETAEEDDWYIVQPRYRLLDVDSFGCFTDPAGALNLYYHKLQHDLVRISSHYRNMKRNNNSIYGLLGSSSGVLRGKDIATAVTMFGRRFIIMLAKEGIKINAKFLYGDTDSAFFHFMENTEEDSIAFLERRFHAMNPYLTLNSTIYYDIFIMSKKKYIASDENGLIFSRGVTRNGPQLWEAQINTFYVKYLCDETVEVYMRDVRMILHTLYFDTYKELMHDAKQVLCSMYVKDVNEYKTQTPAKKLMERILATNPTYVFSNHIHYFHVYKNLAGSVELGLDYELTNYPLEKLNLCKFYGSIIKTIYEILAFAIYRTSQKKHIAIKYSFQEFKKTNLVAFTDANTAFRAYLRERQHVPPEMEAATA